MLKKSIRDMDVHGKRVLVRADFNIPLNDAGEITDETRIKSSLPTIRYLQEQGAKVILMSHLGRPDGQVDEKYRLAPVAEKLSRFLDQPVLYSHESIGPEPEAAIAGMKPGDVLLLENLRFHPEEEKNDAGFAKKLAQLGDVFVNDAFGTAHRAHASTAGIAQYLPAVAGFLMEDELATLGLALERPRRPFAAIIGGAKVSDKIGVLENLLGKVDYLIVGGGMANTFLAAQGYSMGNSKVETDKIKIATDLIAEADAKGVEFLLPDDLVVADKFSLDAQHKVVTVDQVPGGWMALDIGPKSAARFAATIKQAKTIIWNGPMGVFEMAPYAAGTKTVALAVAEAEALSIVGGGDSMAAVKQMGLADQISHISTGGGASLALLEGEILPGVAALLDK